MSVEADYFPADDLFQSDEFAEWKWAMGDPGHYWSFVVIPATANVTVCEITRFWYSADARGNLTAHFIIHIFHEANQTVFGGGFMNFRAIRIPSA